VQRRIAIIGAGDVVRRGYLPALLRRDHCKVNAISSRSARSAADLALAHRIQGTYQGYADVVQDPEIDTVFICTPPHLHKEIAEAAMGCNKNILVEKPLCVNYRDSRTLLRRARGYAKTFYAGFNNYFREENQ